MTPPTRDHHDASSGDPAARAAAQRHELLAGRALGDLSPDESAALAPADLDALDLEPGPLDAAVGSLYLAIASPIRPNPEPAGAVIDTGVLPEPVPPDVLVRLHRLADAYVAAMRSPALPARVPVPTPTSPSVARSQPRSASPLRFSIRPALPWLAVAASLLLAVSAWTVHRATNPATALSQADPIDILQRVRATPDALTIPWSPWTDDSVSAEITGVTGEVTWSDTAQTGVLHLANLPFLPGTAYQLWIIDAQRGMSQRISGAIFQGGLDQAYISIQPKLPVSSAAAFAITIEQPGGTWVSDMSRRVVIAARPTGI